MVKAVLFDLDGVIVDTAKYHFIAWKNLAKNLGIKIDEEFNEQLKGISREESLNKILAYGNKLDDFNILEKERLMEEKNQEYLSLIGKMTQEEMLPGIKDLLLDLKKHKIKISLASASKNGSKILEQLQLTKYFDGIANPNQAKFGKPAPDLYLLAAKEVGVCPSECVGVEDAKAGIEAIKNAQMTSIGIGKNLELKGADKVIDTSAKLTFDLIYEVWEDNHA